MNSQWQTWSLSIVGDDLAAVGEEAKAAMKAFLAKEAATVAEVAALGVNSPSADGLAKFELSFGVRYAKTLTLDEWLDDAMSSAIVGPGPGVMKIPKTTTPPAKVG